MACLLDINRDGSTGMVTQEYSVNGCSHCSQLICTSTFLWPSMVLKCSVNRVKVSLFLFVLTVHVHLSFNAYRTQ